MGRGLIEQSIKVGYLLSKHYRWMHENSPGKSCYVTRSSRPLTILIDSVKFFVWQWVWLAFLFKKEPPDFLCFYNPHPLNFAIAKLAGFFSPDGIRTIYLHEPAKPAKAAYGLRGRLFFEMVEFCQKLALAYSTDVILASPVGVELFEKYFPNYQGTKHYAPLLIPDRPCKTAKERRYFSMVGRFGFSKRLDTFINTINYAAVKGENIKFQIVTACPVKKYLRKLTPAGRSKTHIVAEKQLSDEDISRGVAESIAILSLQPIVTQSGVVPFAFMNSTPVIVRSDPGFTQFVRHKYNGWVLPDVFSCEDVIKAMKFVQDNFVALSANARQSYVDYFSEQNWDKYYSWISKALAK